MSSFRKLQNNLNHQSDVSRIIGRCNDTPCQAGTWRDDLQFQYHTSKRILRPPRFKSFFAKLNYQLLYHVSYVDFILTKSCQILAPCLTCLTTSTLGYCPAKATSGSSAISAALVFTGTVGPSDCLTVCKPFNWIYPVVTALCHDHRSSRPKPWQWHR